jgi:hypothetical protein
VHNTLDEKMRRRARSGMAKGRTRTEGKILGHRKVPRLSLWQSNGRPDGLEQPLAKDGTPGVCQRRSGAFQSDRTIRKEA